MNQCYDKNNTILRPGITVMYIQNGNKNKGLIIDLLPNDQILLDGESGMVTVDVSDCFYLS